MKFPRKHRLKLIIGAILLLWYAFCLPKNLFKEPTATVIESRDGELLGAKISDDEQWRFPHNEEVPEKFERCILLFEDEYFYKHIGVNPISIAKAIGTNIKAKSIKRGGSTLTQQTIRLARKGKKRTYFEKLIEMIWATRLELRTSKKNILSMYASNAPFGGNTVGLDAAAWRYYNRSANDLSWAESATLAVLPNSPSLIYPGKNQEKLLNKRNRLLEKLLQKGDIDSITYELSITEPLPQKPFPLPQIAPHLLQDVHKNYTGERIQTTVDKQLQLQVNEIVGLHYNRLKQNEIYNAAILILDVRNREVLAYVGNTPTTADHQHFVNIVNKPRSTGSILKPFLYCNMLDAGDLLPNTLVADVPTQFGSYRPKNFSEDYMGAVSASRALSKSLNIPSVRLLKEHGLEKFYSKLQELNLTNINQGANHYGLSLILGGAESNLWDLCKSYASMASTLNHFQVNSSQYYSNEFLEPTYVNGVEPNFGSLQSESTVFDAASIYLTFESMKEVNRPEGEENWTFFDSSRQIAWKTGTSFGFRDAWSIGVTQDYVVGVWVGNADGEGRPGLTGLQAAAPILFDVFAELPRSDWFAQPFDEMTQITVCKNSGYRANGYCETDSVYVQLSGLKTPPCPYNRQIQVDESERFRLNADCASIDEMHSKSVFELPPLMAYYYKRQNPFYQSLPPFRDDCTPQNEAVMQFIYPEENNAFFLPTDFDGKTNELISKVAHSKSNQTLFWYLDEEYKGKTTTFHEFAFLPDSGSHIITVVDEDGNKINRRIVIEE